MFSVVVPIYPPHFQYIPRIINNVIQSTEANTLVKEIIFAASQITQEQFQKDIQHLLQYQSNIPILFICSPNQQNAAQNRNIGWNVAKSDYIAFIDADDIYHPDRFIIAKNIIINNNYPDALVGSYNFKKDYKGNFEPIFPPYKIVNSKTIFHLTFPNNTRDVTKETGNMGDTNIESGFQLTQGSTFIKRSITTRFRENMWLGEDGKFLRDILWNNPQNGVVAINEVLMYY